MAARTWTWSRVFEVVGAGVVVVAKTTGDALGVVVVVTAATFVVLKNNVHRECLSLNLTLLLLLLSPPPCCPTARQARHHPGRPPSVVAGR